MPEPTDNADSIARLAARPSDDLAALLLRERDRKDGEIRDLKRQLKAAKTAVPEGGRVLTKDETAAFEGFTKLGTLADVTKRLTDGDAATQRAAALEAERTIERAASAGGYKSAVLADLAKAKGFTVELVEETVNGTKTPVPYAVPVGTDGKAGAKVKLTEYVTANLADYVPALTADASSTSRGASAARTGATAGGTSTTQRTGTAGAAYPTQAGGSTAPKADNLFQRIREDRNAEREKATAASKPLEERLGKLAGV